MAILTSGQIEKDAVEMGASMMAVSARTAPKTRGGRFGQNHHPNRGGLRETRSSNGEEG